MSDILIYCQQVCKFYYMGNEVIHALNNIDLTIKQNEYVSILGTSGSGKSTLMHVLGCLDAPTSGLYAFSGNDVSKLTASEIALIRNRKIGFIFQDFYLFPYMNVLDNVAFPLIFQKTNKKQRRAKALDLLKKVGLEGRISHYPNQLSGGQKQRAVIARALVTNPDIILADEPTGNLDTHSSQGIIQIFESLLNQNKTLILVTHDQNLAKRTNRVLQMCDGRLVG